MNNRNTRFEIGGLSFVLYFIYSLSVWLCDAFDLFCFFTEMPQVTLVSRSIILMIMIGLCFGLRHKMCFRKENRMDSLFVAGALIILGFWTYKGIIPDMSLDVRSYHLLVQKPGFASMTKGNSFLPGGFQYYGFRWADRTFFLFRALLGYRLGTIWGGMVTVLIFWQMRSLLVELYGEKLLKIRKELRKVFKQPIFPGIFLTESAFAFLITLTYDVLLQSGGYMVEPIGIPFILEAVYILLVKKEQKCTGEMMWFAFLCGCFFAIKMTHVVYIAPMILTYLFKHRKNITFKRFVVSFAIAIIPVSIYLLYAYADTGNPVFPYFNSIFKSPYFLINDFKDIRWGPQSFGELIAWPILSVIRPEYRTSEIPNYNNFGMLCLAGAVVVKGLQYVFSSQKKNGELLFVVICSAYLWSASTGHVRYFMVGYMLMGILFTECVVDCFYEKKRALSIISVVFMFVIALQSADNAISIAWGKEWSWRNNFDRRFFGHNLKYALNDRFDLCQDSETIGPEVNTVLRNISVNGGFTEMLCPETPIIHNGYLQSSISDSDIRTYWMDRIDMHLKEGGVYEILSPGQDEINWNSYFETLDKYGLKAKSIVWPETVFLRNHALAFVELEKLETEKNILCIANQENNSLPVPNQKIHFSADIILCQGLGEGWRESEDFPVSLIARDGKITREVFCGMIKEKETIHINQDLDLTAFDENVMLQLCWEDPLAGKADDTWTYQCLMICPEIDVIE